MKVALINDVFAPYPLSRKELTYLWVMSFFYAECKCRIWLCWGSNVSMAFFFLLKLELPWWLSALLVTCRNDWPWTQLCKLSWILSYYCSPFAHCLSRSRSVGGAGVTGWNELERFFPSAWSQDNGLPKVFPPVLNECLPSLRLLKAVSSSAT